jgi:hypothetical protein
MNPATQPSPPRSKTLKEFAASHGLDAATARDQILTGKLIAHKVGRITIITEEAERTWLASLPLAVPNPKAKAKA